MKEYSEIDPLTQLYNRRGVYRQMDVLYHHQEQLKHHAMLMIDADGLKRINDIDGHDMGDRYLSALASLIQKILPSKTISARFGATNLYYLFMVLKMKQP